MASKKRKAEPVTPGEGHAVASGFKTFKDACFATFNPATVDHNRPEFLENRLNMAYQQGWFDGKKYTMNSVAKTTTPPIARAYCGYKVYWWSGIVYGKQHSFLCCAKSLAQVNRTMKAMGHDATPRRGHCGTTNNPEECRLAGEHVGKVLCVPTSMVAQKAPPWRLLEPMTR